MKKEINDLTKEEVEKLGIKVLNLLEKIDKYKDNNKKAFIFNGILHYLSVLIQFNTLGD